MLTLERLKLLLSYNAGTGEWRWLAPRGGHCTPGNLAGNVDETRQGRRRIMIDGEFYESNRLAVFYMTGEWPEAEVDHRDRRPSNDRYGNLRPATMSQNRNNRAAWAKSGLKGVYRCIRHGHIRFEVYLSNPRVFVGTFRSPVQAAWEYDQKAVDHYGEFAVLNFMRSA